VGDLPVRKCKHRLFVSLREAASFCLVTFIATAARRRNVVAELSRELHEVCSSARPAQNLIGLASRECFVLFRRARIYSDEDVPCSDLLLYPLVQSLFRLVLTVDLALVRFHPL